MSALSSPTVGKAWDDPALKGAILTKGQRRPRTAKPVAVVAEVTPMLCTNCRAPIGVRFDNHCRCSIWEVGKRPAQGV